MDKKREQFMEDLGNPYVNPCSDNLKLLFEYINLENNIIRDFDEEDGIDVNSPDYVPESMMLKRLDDMEEYRMARTLLACVQKMIKDGLIHKDTEYVASLDRAQRRKHNKALTSLMGMNEFARKHGLREIYTGKLVDKKDIRDMGAGDLEARAEMTNFFLGLLNELSDFNIKQIQNSFVKQQLRDVQRKISTTCSKYDVKKPLSQYNGNIEFYR